MKIRNYILSGLFAFGLSAMPIINAQAQDKAAPVAKEPRTPKMIVIDVQRIMAQSEAAKGVRAQVDSLRKDIQAEVTKQQNALQAEEKELAKQQGKGNAEEFNKKRQAFADKVNNTRRAIDTRVASVDKAVNKASGQIEQELQKVLFELAKEKGAGLVLPKQAVLVAETAMDFTDEALAQLNKRLPKVSVNVEKPAAAEPKKK